MKSHISAYTPSSFILELAAYMSYIQAISGIFSLRNIVIQDHHLHKVLSQFSRFL